MKEEHFIRDLIQVKDDKQNLLRIFLNYDDTGTPIIEGINRISRPGRRIYVNARDVPRVRGGLGISILTTSRGVISDKIARRLKVGGEVLCEVW